MNIQGKNGIGGAAKPGGNNGEMNVGVAVGAAGSQTPGIKPVDLNLGNVSLGDRNIQSDTTTTTTEVSEGSLFREAIVFSFKDLGDPVKLEEALNKNCIIRIKGYEVKESIETTTMPNSEGALRMKASKAEEFVNDEGRLEGGEERLFVPNREQKHLRTEYVPSSPKLLIDFFSKDENQKYFHLVESINLNIVGISGPRNSVLCDDLNNTVLLKCTNLKHLYFHQTAGTINIASAKSLETINLGKVVAKTVKIFNYQNDKQQWAYRSSETPNLQELKFETMTWTGHGKLVPTDTPCSALTKMQEGINKRKMENEAKKDAQESLSVVTSSSPEVVSTATATSSTAKSSYLRYYVALMVAILSGAIAYYTLSNDNQA